MEEVYAPGVLRAVDSILVLMTQIGFVMMAVITPLAPAARK